MKSLLQYDWPGNVRELENCIARGVTLGDQEVIDVQDLPPAIRAEQPAHLAMTPQDAASLSTTALAEMEKMTILRVFEQAHGDKALAGKMLGISRATLYRKLKRYNIPSTRGRRRSSCRRATGACGRAVGASQASEGIAGLSQERMRQ